MLLRRILTTFDLVFWFLSKPRGLTLIAFPFVLWFMKRLFLGRTVFRYDVTVLIAVYAVVILGIFGWQFAKSAAVLSNEPKFYSEVEKLDSQEQSELRRLVNTGKIPVGPAVFDHIAAKTAFIYRDVSGEWRIENEYKRFLKRWEKASRR